MTTAQPKWKLIANLGDVHPLDYGGYFIYVDETGAYEPQAEYLEERTEGEKNYTVYRFDLTQCTFVNGVLSDNKFHPDHSAWFAKTEAEKAERPQDTTYLSNVAETADIPESELIRLLCSDNPVERAQAYRDIASHHGWENFDSYPLTLTLREAKRRYK